MLKSRQIDLNDSNIANLGTEIEKKVRAAPPPPSPPPARAPRRATAC